MKNPIYLIMIVLVLGCKVQSKFDRDYPEYFSGTNTVESYPMINDSTLKVSIVSADIQYGRTAENPVFVGVTNVHEGDKNRYRYLNGLEMADGRAIQFERLKSCCPFKTKNSRTIGADQKFGLLDVWLLYPIDEPHKTDTLYINAYDQGTPMIPTGYRAKSQDINNNIE